MKSLTFLLLDVSHWVVPQKNIVTQKKDATVPQCPFLWNCISRSFAKRNEHSFLITIHIGRGGHTIGWGGATQRCIIYTSFPNHFPRINSVHRLLDPSPISSISPPSASYITSIQGNIYHIHTQAHICSAWKTCIFTYILNPKKLDRPCFSHRPREMIWGS